jgi:hypothetical protein
MGLGFDGSWVVRAARGGKVSAIKDDSNTGCGTDICQNYANYVKVDTQDGYETLYLHLVYLSVRSRIYLGEVIDRYTAIGVSDTTGFATGPHLHYQVQYASTTWWYQSVTSSFVDPSVLSDPLSGDGIPKVNQTVVSGNYLQLPRIAVASPSSGRLDLFVRNTSLGVSHRYQDGSGLHAWENLGSGTGNGYFVGEPSAASWGANRIDVFAIGGDGNLWHRYWDGTAWNPAGQFENLSNGGHFLIGTPSAVAWGVNKLTVFARDLSGALDYWDCTGPTCQWHPTLGGWLATDPMAISSSPDHVDVVLLGNLGHTFHQFYTATSGVYSGYEDWGTANNGSVFVSQPTTASYDASHVDAFNVSADGNLWTKHNNGTSWGAWQLMGMPPSGLVYGSAAAVDLSSGVWATFVRDSNAAAWNCWWTGSHCPSSWESHGGTMTTEPTLISVSPYQLDFFVRGTDQAVWHQGFVSPGPWFGWESWGGVMT